MGLGREDHGHCSPPKMLFTGNNPHYLPLLWSNQTIANAKGCFLRPLGGNSRKGAGAGGAGRGRRWHLPDLSRLQHSFRYLTPGHPDFVFQSPPSGESPLYNKEGFLRRGSGISKASAWRAPLTSTLRSRVPSCPWVHSLPCPPPSSPPGPWPPQDASASRCAAF